MNSQKGNAKLKTFNSKERKIVLSKTGNLTKSL